MYTLDIFKEALQKLDGLLELNPKVSPIEIKAIGGFAMLFYGMRHSMKTQDIDSVTPDWDEDQIKLIERVAVVMDLEADWLNNYNVMDNDVEAVEIMLEPFWDKIDWGLKRVQLYVGDTETLLRSKLLATEDSEQTGRQQDLPDLISILSNLKILTRERFVATVEDMGMDAETEFPYALEVLENSNAFQ